MAPVHGSQTIDHASMSPSSPISVLTLVLWVPSLMVGVLGILVPYNRPVAPGKEPPPIHAEVLEARLTAEPFSVAEPEAAPQNLSTPSLPPSIPVLTALPAVARVPLAQASHALDFPSIEAASIQSSTQAVASGSVQSDEAEPAAMPSPGPLILTYGQGEGKQPAPEYPRRAMAGGQEGTTVVRFSVGENGRVLAAEAVSRSPWPLLNEAAVRVIRERWRFRPGALRLYEVAIRFQLQK
jgi:protein TonB